jgi:hypothetical protein
MIQEPGLSYLIDWRNFYILISTAAATLIGLTFVATTLLAGMNRHISTINAGISAFNTPTVVHFCAVFLIGVIMVAPWANLLFLRIVLCIVGLCGVIYLFFIAQKMRNIPNRITPINDWLLYMAFPLVGYVVLVFAAIVMPSNPATILYFIGLATLVLLFIGIRDAWDLVTYLVIERSHPGKQVK